MSTVFAKVPKNLGVLLRVHVFYVCIGPCNLSTKAKTTSTVLKPIYLNSSTIFVHANLGKVKDSPLSHPIKNKHKIWIN